VGVGHAKEADNAVGCPSDITGKNLRWSTGPTLMAAETGDKTWLHHLD